MARSSILVRTRRRAEETPEICNPCGFSLYNRISALLLVVKPTLPISPAKGFCINYSMYTSYIHPNPHFGAYGEVRKKFHVSPENKGGLVSSWRRS